MENRLRKRADGSSDQSNGDRQGDRADEGRPDVIHQFNVHALLRDRADQPSFHVLAERHLRIEFRNLEAGTAVGPFTYEGDVLITCWTGVFSIEAGASTTELRELEQAVIPSGTLVRLACGARGSIQLIWSPPHAATRQA